VATVGAAILAGGRASRLGGCNKALLSLRGERFIDRQLRVLRPLFDPVLIVANDPAAFAGLGVRVIPDLSAPATGPLVGILSALEQSPADALVCVGCDMPLLDPRALALVRDFAPEADVVVPAVAGRLEPLHARYARRVCATIRAQLARGEAKVDRLYATVATVHVPEADLRAIDPTLSFFENVNSPEDLLRLDERA
jgi:molybdopterin-guanine dinucleotide biosynthesis protein A